jgi:hypothetical protein
MVSKHPRNHNPIPGMAADRRFLEPRPATTQHRRPHRPPLLAPLPRRAARLRRWPTQLAPSSKRPGRRNVHRFPRCPAAAGRAIARGPLARHHVGNGGGRDAKDAGMARSLAGRGLRFRYLPCPYFSGARAFPNFSSTFSAPNPPFDGRITRQGDFSARQNPGKSFSPVAFASLPAVLRVCPTHASDSFPYPSIPALIPFGIRSYSSTLSSIPLCVFLHLLIPFGIRFFRLFQPISPCECSPSVSARRSTRAQLAERERERLVERERESVADVESV